MYMIELSSILLAIYVLLIIHTRRYFVFVFYITHSFSLSNTRAALRGGAEEGADEDDSYS
jgi:hypothetical protein